MGSYVVGWPRDLWRADKVAYNNNDNYVRAYVGNNIVWDKNPDNKLFYKTDTQDIMLIDTESSGAPAGIQVVSNTYTPGVGGVVEFNMPLTKLWRSMFYSDIEEDEPYLTYLMIPPKVTDISDFVGYPYNYYVHLDGIAVHPDNSVYFSRFYVPGPGPLSEDSFFETNAVFKTKPAGREDASILDKNNYQLVLGTSNTILPDYTPSQDTGDRLIDSVGWGAFKMYYRYDVDSIDLKYIRYIGAWAFDSNPLKYFNMPYVEEIGTGAFEGSYIQGDLDLRYLSSLGSYTFMYCDDLVNINMPSVTRIEENTFNQCWGLETVNIPNVTDIGSMAFWHCSSLRNMNMPSVIRIESSAFEEAFRNSSVQIFSIVIPNTIQSIGQNAFKNCLRLVTVAVNATTPPTLGTGAFDGCSPNLQILVPAGSVQAYKTATGWSTYANKIVSQ